MVVNAVCILVVASGRYQACRRSTPFRDPAQNSRSLISAPCTPILKLPSTKSDGARVEVLRLLPAHRVSVKKVASVHTVLYVAGVAKGFVNVMHRLWKLPSATFSPDQPTPDKM